MYVKGKKKGAATVPRPYCSLLISLNPVSHADRPALDALIAAGKLTIGLIDLRQRNAVAKVHDDALILHSNTHRHTPQHIAQTIALGICFLNVCGVSVTTVLVDLDFLGLCMRRYAG